MQNAKNITFWLISLCFFYFFLFAAFIPQAIAQKQSSSQIQTLKSFKIKINNYLHLRFKNEGNCYFKKRYQPKIALSMA